MGNEILLPNGKPAPSVLTLKELIELLRIEGKNPERTIKYYRDVGLLRGIKLGRHLRYRLEDVQEFLAQKSWKAKPSNDVGIDYQNFDYFHRRGIGEHRKG